MNTNKIDYESSDYEKMKAKFLRIGVAIPGIIRETYLRCGRQECACAKKDGNRHGPYYFWTRKVDGRMTSKSIQKDKLPLYEKWISNRRDLEALVQVLLSVGQDIAATLPPETETRNMKGQEHSKRKK